jgi:hypothetical protein
MAAEAHALKRVVELPQGKPPKIAAVVLIGRSGLVAYYLIVRIGVSQSIPEIIADLVVVVYLGFVSAVMYSTAREWVIADRDGVEHYFPIAGTIRITWDELTSIRSLPNDGLHLESIQGKEIVVSEEFRGFEEFCRLVRSRAYKANTIN